MMAQRQSMLSNTFYKTSSGFGGGFGGFNNDDSEEEDEAEYWIEVSDDAMINY